MSEPTPPPNQYETIEGTKPEAHVQHEPRTVTRERGDEFWMMTEIGDGTFVQWGNCTKCTKRVRDCQCVGGPVEPDYMKRWRDERFDRDLNARPEPSYKLLPKIIEMLVERGYTVTPPTTGDAKAKRQAEADKETEDLDILEDEAQRDLEDPEPLTDYEVQIDSGLTQALDGIKALRAARDTSGIQVDF